MKKLQSITNKYLFMIIIFILIIIWQIASDYFNVASYLLPAPTKIANAIVNDYSLLFKHSLTTFYQASVGLILAIMFSYAIAIVMDFSDILHQIIYPFLIISQTIPTIAIAPLLVIWLGYGASAKIAVVFLVCFFPLTMSIVKGFKSVDTEMLTLMRAMKATKKQTMRYVKLYASLPDFFNGLKLATTYAIVGSVIAEWLGGDSGLGVYMIRVRKSFSYDKMFAVIIIITLVSVILVYFVSVMERKTMPWKNQESGGK